MGQIYRVNLNEKSKLMTHEKKILFKYAEKLIMPLTIVSEESLEYINYLTDGFIPLNKFRFSRLGEIFLVVQTLVESYLDAQKHLLNPFRLFSDSEHIFISNSGYRAIALFGKDRNYGTLEDSDDRLILPMIHELSMQNDVVCARDAMDGIFNKIHGKNYSLVEILKIVQASQREWSLILPAGFEMN